jgi:uncharacterized protein YjbJ (UPF0337 family)
VDQGKGKVKQTYGDVKEELRKDKTDTRTSS